MSKLEETFNLPITDAEDEEIGEIQNPLQSNGNERVNKFIQEFSDTLTETEMSDLVDLQKYDEEMDEIAEKTLTEFDDLVVLGKDVEMKYAGEILSAAAQMAKISLDAKTNKTNARLKILELSIRRKRNEILERKQEHEINGSQSNTIEGKIMNRDDLIKTIEERMKAKKES